MGLSGTFTRNRQLILLILGLFPGLLAYAKIISGAQATLALIILFVISRRFASVQQKQFELEEADRIAEEQRLAALAKRKGKGKGKGKSD